MEKTYELAELAKLLSFNKAYVRMNLKKFDEYDPNAHVPEALASKVAAVLKRQWPPAEA